MAPTLTQIAEKPKAKRKFRVKATVFGTFILTTLVVIVRWVLRHPVSTSATSPFTVVSWALFYLACFAVIIVGCREAAALEGVVYLITLAGEAVLPGLCVHLVSHLKYTVKVPEPILEITAHLMLTLMSCALLLGWGVVLAFKSMRKGKTPLLIIIYVFATLLSGLVVVFFAILNPDDFVNPKAVEQGILIPAVWPAMIAIPMSYFRMGLTVITMFLPWVRTAIDTD